MSGEDKLLIGDIVLILFPFTDNQTFKKRPALVIKDTKDGDVIVCRITSKLYNTMYDIALPNWQHHGLILPSVVRVHKIAAIEKSLIERVIGRIDDITELHVIRIFGDLLQ